MFTPVTLQSCEPRVVACESGKTPWASGLAAGSRAREHDDEHRRHRPPKGSRIRGAVAGLTKQGNAWCSASARMDTNGCLDRPLHPGPWIPRRTGACGSVHGIAHACGNGASVSRCVCVCAGAVSRPLDRRGCLHDPSQTSYPPGNQDFQCVKVSKCQARICRRLAHNGQWRNPSADVQQRIKGRRLHAQISRGLRRVAGLARWRARPEGAWVG